MTLSQLRDHLPPFPSFSIIESTYVQAYLEHYQLKGLAKKQCIGTIKSGHHKLVTQGFFTKNAKTSAIIIHGFLDHSGLYHKLIAHLLSLQINVFIIDLPGHGLSSGHPASIDSFKQYSDAIEQLAKTIKTLDTPSPWILIGQSMGGAIAMSVLKRSNLAINKTILLAPLVQPYGWRYLSSVHSALHNFIISIPRRFKGNSHDEVFNAFLSQHDTLQSHTIPIEWINAMRTWRHWFLSTAVTKDQVLLIQGTKDKTIDWRYGRKMVQKKFRHTQIKMIKNAQHHLVNESPEYLSEVFGAISDFLGEEDLKTPY